MLVMHDPIKLTWGTDYALDEVGRSACNTQTARPPTLPPTPVHSYQAVSRDMMDDSQ